MANNLSSNVTGKLLKIFLKKFESDKILCKSVDKAILNGEVTDDTGGTVSVKRPHQYNAIRTAGGDISSSTKSDILSGKATGTVQNYITVATEWSNKEEALQLNQLEKIIEPMAERCVIELETSLSDYMIKNSGLSYGVPGTAVDAWTDVSGAMALLKSIGVDSAMCHYVMNPFTAVNLASAQTGLSADPSRLVQTAWESAQISPGFGGLRAVTSNSITTWTNGTSADRIGALSATPTATYASVKDTMTQTWAVTGFTADAELKAGDIVEVTGRYHVNVKTRSTFTGADGAPVKFRCTLNADATLDASGEGNIVVTAPAIYESNGQYNNVSSAVASGDVITILGATATEYQPSLFYHPQAFGLTTVKIDKLFSTDTLAVSEEGFTIRCSKYSDGDANTQKIRFDLVPVFATFNPMFAGKGFGK